MEIHPKQVLIFPRHSPALPGAPRHSPFRDNCVEIRTIPGNSVQLCVKVCGRPHDPKLVIFLTEFILILRFWNRKPSALLNGGVAS